MKKKEKRQDVCETVLRTEITKSREQNTKQSCMRYFPYLISKRSQNAASSLHRLHVQASSTWSRQRTRF